MKVYLEAADLHRLHQDGDLWAFVEADPTQTVREIANGLRVRTSAVTGGLKRLGNVKKLEKWMTRVLPEIVVYRNQFFFASME